MVGAWIELPYYAFRRGRYSHGLQVMTSAVLYLYVPGRPLLNPVSCMPVVTQLVTRAPLHN
jgi:hypothetical protein